MPAKLLRLEDKCKTLASWLNYVAGAALVVMMLLVNANVILRTFGQPIWGSYEIVGFLGSVVISFALIYPTIHKTHMAVELITSRLPSGFQNILNVMNHLLVMVVLGLIARESYEYGLQIWHSSQVSETLGIPFHPILFGIAFAFAAATLVQIVVWLRLFRKVKKN